jgi:hypothetical protein
VVVDQVAAVESPNADQLQCVHGQEDSIVKCVPDPESAEVFGQGGISPYTQQAVAYNNIVVNNGAKGIEINDNSAGSSHATIWFSQNTSWGNLTDPNQSWYGTLRDFPL